MRALLAAPVLAGGLLAVAPSPAYACSCVSDSARSLLERADVVVAGTVVERHDPATGPVLSTGDPITYVVAVDDVYEGRVSGRLELTSARDGSSCGIEGVRDGRRELFLLDATDTGYAGSLCGGTGWVTEQQAERVLGEPQPPAQEDPAATPTAEAAPAPTGDGGPGWTYAAAAVPVLAGAGWWARRRSVRR